MFTKYTITDTGKMIYFIFATVLLHYCLAQADSPCPDCNIACIREYFSERAVNGCGTITGNLPEPLFDDYNCGYFPLINSTLIQYNLSLSNFDQGMISAFVVDKTTDITLLEITFTNLTIEAEEIKLEYYQPGAPPIFQSFSAVLVIDSVRMTVYFNGIDSLDLNNAYGYSYVEGEQTFTTNPSAHELASCLTPVSKAIANNLPEFTKQAAGALQTLFVAGNFIQSDVCDFGVNLLKI